MVTSCVDNALIVPRTSLLCVVPIPYLFPGIQFDSDLHMFDTTTNDWTYLSSQVLGVQPDPRSSHGFTLLGQRLYIHGGSADGDGTGRLSHS